MRNVARWIVPFLLIIVLLGCVTTEKAKVYPEFTGSVTSIEKYGHAVTTIKADAMFEAGYAVGDVVTVTYDNGYTFDAPIVPGYEVDEGQFLVRTEHADGFVACCINYGKMFQVAGIDVGTKLTIKMKQPQGYANGYMIRSLTWTDKREDYASDEVFANYRPVLGGTLKEGVLYRSCHPTKTKWTRAPYVSALMERDGIQCVLNMADSETENTKYLDASNPYASAYYKQLYDQGKVALLSMVVSYTSEDFGQGVAKGIRFLLSHDGPYLVHCNEGKDRTGFFCVFIEALMGASEKEIKEDYMTSYINYYHVEVGSEKYKAIEEGNVDPMLTYLKGDKKSLQEGAKAYASSISLSDAEITALMEKLSK